MSASDVKSGAGRKSPGRRSGSQAQPVPKATPERQADVLAAERERERQLRWIAIGASVAMAVVLPIVRQVWRWLREDRMRARVDREILRELGA